MAEAGAREDERILECDTCTVPQGKPQAYCLQCDAFICEECLTSHKVMRKFSFHTVSSLTDMEQDLAEERAAISHTESTNKTTPNIKKLLQEKVSMLKQLAAENSRDIEDVETAKLQVESQTHFTTDTITGDFHRLRQILGKSEISNNKTTKCSVAVVSKLNSVRDESVLKCTVVQENTSSTHPLSKEVTN